MLNKKTNRGLCSMKMWNGLMISLVIVSLLACASAKNQTVTSNPSLSQQTKSESSENQQTTKMEVPDKSDTVKQNSQASEIPVSYKEIQFPPFQYEIPKPNTYRVSISDSITGYIVEDHSLPIASLQILFRESTVSQNEKEIAEKELLSGMFRRGGSRALSAAAIDDSLEFISASISGSLNSRNSVVTVLALSRDFYATALLAREIFTKPAFEKEQLELQKAAFVTAYERRFDTPSAVLAALRAKVNYASTPRFWDANKKEYETVSRQSLLNLSVGKFSTNRVVFAFAGDLPKDSVLSFLKDYFKNWSVSKNKETEKAEESKLLRTPGIFAVERQIAQANIALNQPFVKRPHPDYYPTAVASFILGGGSFSSRLMNRIRTNEGLAYSVYSAVGNSYYDTTLTTVALQTKADQAAYAIQLVYQEIDSLVKFGPTDEELELAKKTLVESLPGMFATSEDIASTFADNEFIGKKENHFEEYVREIQSVTKEQVKTMIARYFAPEKMTISIVGPAVSWKGLPNVKVIPLDSLEMRP